MLKNTMLAVASLLIFSPASAAVVQGDYLGTSGGNDSEAALLAAIGVSVLEVEKIDSPATANGDFQISNFTFNGDGEPTSGEWSYTGTELVDYIVIKAGPAFAIYHYTDLNTSNMRNMGIWDTSGVDNKGLSHITAYTVAAVPVPAALWLMASGLTGLGFLRRRQ